MAGEFLHRVRAVTVTALMWSIAWLPVGIIEGSFRYLTQSPYHAVPIGDHLRWSATFWMVLGAVSGVCFAVILAAAERRSTLDDMKLRRMAIWGGLGAVAVPIMTLLSLVLVGGEFVPDGRGFVRLAAIAVLGAISAISTLLLARRGVTRHPRAAA